MIWVQMTVTHAFFIELTDVTQVDKDTNSVPTDEAKDRIHQLAEGNFLRSKYVCEYEFS